MSQKPGRAGLFLFILVGSPAGLRQSLRHPALLLSGRGKPDTRRLQDCDSFCLRQPEACDDTDRCYARQAFEIAIPIARLFFERSAGLPCFDEQKKTRLRSHLSA
jgi:hypothetical protein